MTYKAGGVERTTYWHGKNHVFRAVSEIASSWEKCCIAFILERGFWEGTAAPRLPLVRHERPLQEPHFHISTETASILL